MGQSAFWTAANRPVQARIPVADQKRLKSLLTRRGLSFRQWLLCKIDADASERLPDSQGEVKEDVPADISALSHQALLTASDDLTARASASRDPAEKADLRAEAAVVMDADGWLLETEELRASSKAGRALRVIPAGVSRVCHRYLLDAARTLKMQAPALGSPAAEASALQAAQRYIKAASWWASVEDDRRYRARLLESGARRVETRGDRRRVVTDSAPTQPAIQALKPRLSPQVAIPSATRERPTG